LAKAIECAQARYEVQDVEFGKVYKWRPGCIVIECQCGQRLSLTASTTSCAECGTDHVLAYQRGIYYSEDHEDAGLPF
jgi:hypothetical protein